MRALTAVEALLALGALLELEPLDRLPSGASRLPMLKVGITGFGTERPLGVGDAIALVVVAEQGVGLPPEPPAVHALGRLAELPSPGRPFQLSRFGVDAARALDLAAADS